MTEMEKAGTLLGEALLGAICAAVREEIRTALKISEYGGQSDRVLDTEAAAKILAVSKDWLYRNGRRLPFTRKVGPKALRFSYLGMQEWILKGNFDEPVTATLLGIAAGLT